MVWSIFDKIRRTPVATIPELLGHTAPEGARGVPEIALDPGTPAADMAGIVAEAVASCPARALSAGPRGGLALDLGRCHWCGLCAEETGALTQSTRYTLATRRRSDLVLGDKDPDGDVVTATAAAAADATPAATAAEIRRLLGRSVHLRHVDSGSCNGCDWEMTHLLNPVYDLQRFGVDFVASPRHADLLLVTGGVTRNLEMALTRTFEAAGEPKLVVAVGTCACGGGLWGETYAHHGGVDKVVPVAAYVPGCPPKPEAILQGILKAVGRLP